MSSITIKMIEKLQHELRLAVLNCARFEHLQGIYLLNKNDICSITYTHVGISPDFLLTLHLDPFHEFDSEYVLRRLILRTSPSIDRRHQT